MTARPAAGFGERLRALRLRRGLAQKDLAGPGVSTSYVSRLESGERAPSPQVVAHLAATLGVEPAELVGRAPAVEQRQALLWCEAVLAHRDGETSRAVTLLDELGSVAEEPMFGWSVRWTRAALLARGQEPEQLIVATEELLDAWSPGAAVDALVEVMRAAALRQLGRTAEAVHAVRTAVALTEDPQDALTAATHLRCLVALCSELARAARLAEAEEAVQQLGAALRDAEPDRVAVSGWWVKAQVEDRLGRRAEASRSIVTAQRLLDAVDVEPQFRHRVSLAAVAIGLRAEHPEVAELTAVLNNVAATVAPRSQLAAQVDALRGELALRVGDARAAWELAERALAMGALDHEDELRCRVLLVRAAVELADAERLLAARSQLADLLERLGSVSIDPALWRNVAQLALRAVVPGRRD
ncbi:helix-turn-helix domain-containing protein [Streptoalloteichus hindustanus]|uniref:Transcriptional regulator, contains XRE-family HTH domain n=1 Tax=Streptoalloteichus hindustanus TaxID=2017 RepID=A0A1M5Q7V5_STRHI|nr:helix-turn-helix transcriptional regulator [Streptoalloteichus hindustanus]SHH09996.1 Transcriptional regulator, contains XRE-family HTH domain [Streptoalloteichus hindustanus]